MAKDVNIHLKTTGAARTKQQLDETGKSAQQVGHKTAEGAKTGGQATEQSTQKLSGMGRVLSTLKTQALGFIGAWVGLKGVQAGINYLITALEKALSLRKEIYQETVKAAEIGQALEVQTGTRGMQQYWAEFAIQIQKAGALASAQIAQQMLISMDIAFQQLGGIKAPRIQELAKQFAPIVGATGLGPEEVGQFFKFAGVAGIQPTAESYKEFFSKILAAYRSSESQIFGQFITGLQKGGTAYMMGGGTLEETLSAYSAAIAVTANEQLAATLIERIARLSGGAYERPRKAIEKGLGVRWGELSMDERFRALLRHMEEIPESRRTEILTEQGFPAEIATEASKLVSPKAKRTLAATGEQVAAATSAMIENLTRAYLDSILAEKRQLEARGVEKAIKLGPKMRDWEERLTKAQQDFRDLATQFTDRSIKDSIEPYVMILEQMQDELHKLIPRLPEGELRKQALQLQKKVVHSFAAMTEPGLGFLYPAALAEGRGVQYTRELNAIYEAAKKQGIQLPVTGIAEPAPKEVLEVPAETKALEAPAKPVTTEVPVEQRGPVTINHHHDHSLHCYPSVHPDRLPGPRFSQFT